MEQTLEFQTSIGEKDSISYKGTESKSVNIKLLGNSVLMTNNKVVSYVGNIYLATYPSEQIGNFEYRKGTQDASSVMPYPMADVVRTSITNGQYLQLNTEAAKLLELTIEKIESTPIV